jgi:hypothetical protein
VVQGPRAPVASPAAPRVTATETKRPRPARQVPRRPPHYGSPVRNCQGQREIESFGAGRGGRTGRCARRNCHKNRHKTHSGASGGKKRRDVSLGFNAT